MERDKPCPLFIIHHNSVACAVGPSVNPLQNRETQHVNIVLQCMYQFFEQKSLKKINISQIMNPNLTK